MLTAGRKGIMLVKPNFIASSLLGSNQAVWRKPLLRPFSSNIEEDLFGEAEKTNDDFALFSGGDKETSRGGKQPKQQLVDSQFLKQFNTVKDKEVLAFVKELGDKQAHLKKLEEQGIDAIELAEFETTSGKQYQNFILSKKK